MAETVLGTLPAGEYPYLHEVVADYILKTGFNSADEFEFGLDLILDGLERARDVS
jgi:hypothetical protein